MDGSEKPGFLYVGNRLWLDFVNTEIVADGRRVDLLGFYGDVVKWAQVGGAFALNEAEHADAHWARTPDGAGGVAAAREFRRTLRAMAERIAGGGEPTDAELDAINAVLRDRPGATQVERTAEGFRERWNAPLRRPQDVLAPVALSAARSLAHDDFALLRKCGNPQCILYFYDTTKNHGRRWCSMDACGNRAKVAAFHQRRRAAR
jgi:predicted RNA-binding Zn ribbon-like protein